MDGIPVAEYLTTYEEGLRVRTGLRVGPLRNSVEVEREVVLGGDALVYHVGWCG